MKRLARAAFEKIQNSDVMTLFQVSFRAGRMRCARGNSDLSEQTLAKYPKSVAGYYTHSATPEMIEADLLAL